MIDTQKKWEPFGVYFISYAPTAYGFMIIGSANHFIFVIIQ